MGSIAPNSPFAVGVRWVRPPYFRPSYCRPIRAWSIHGRAQRAPTRIRRPMTSPLGMGSMAHSAIISGRPRSFAAPNPFQPAPRPPLGMGSIVGIRAA
jgi:hypothetical protein